MLVDPVHYSLGPPPSWVLIVLGNMLSGVAWGVWYVARFIWRNRRTAGDLLHAGLDEGGEKRDTGGEVTDLNAALLQFLRAQEAREVAAREEAVRQWQKIGEVMAQMERHADVLQVLVGHVEAQTKEIEATTKHFELLNQQQAATLQRIETNQVNMATWIYQNLGRSLSQGFAPPPFAQPAPGRGSGT